MKFTQLIAIFFALALGGQACESNADCPVDKSCIMDLKEEVASFLEPSAGSIEALRKTLLSNVPECHVATCEDFLLRLLRMMRHAACVTGFLYFRHPEAPIIKSADECDLLGRS
ncbi:hypothetical protein BST61_g8669 [Cercospora zeina]